MRIMSGSYRDKAPFARPICDLASVTTSANPPPGPNGRSVQTYPDIGRVLSRTRNSIITGRKYGFSRPCRTTIGVVFVGFDSTKLQTHSPECAAAAARAKNVNLCEK